MDYSTILMLILFAWTCIYAVLVRRDGSPESKLPPGPVPLPIVGSLLKLGDKPHQSLAELAKIHGPLMTIKLGSVTTVVATSVIFAKEVLQKHDQALSGRMVADGVRALNYHESTMAWLPTNPHWRKLRMICNTEIFTSQRLDTNQGLRHQKARDLVDYVRKNSLSGEAVDIGRAAFVTTLNLISNTVFSIDLVDLSSQSAQEVKDVVRGIMDESGRPNLADYFPVLRFIDPQGVRHRVAAHFQKLHSIFDRLIDDRVEARASSTSPRKNDFLDVLLDHTGEEKDFQISRKDIKSLLVEIFSAGSDTTSSTVEWAMAELLRNPNVMEKARSEIINTFGAGYRVAESDIGCLPYLKAIVKETFRLHPPVPLLIPRRAESSVEISGFIIPRNAQLFVNVWAMGRDPDLWANPTSFSPERFLGSDLDSKGQHFELIPFGAGRRICPGMPLAFRMVHLMLAYLLQSFVWKLPDGMTPKDMDMREKFGITLQMAVPLHAIPIQEN